MGRFSSFVVFAEMRTGSNFLEANLNALPGVACYGEAFNPHFIGYPKNDPILGVDLAARDAQPQRLLTAIRDKAEGLGGFRYFHDHDPRVFDAVMADESCAKIILTRNPVDSYVSWKIARQTGQWKLTDMKARKAAQVRFDAEEFEAHLEALQAFQITLLNRLQVTGQTAFYIAYEDLQDVDVINGMAAFLGVEGRLESLDKSLKKQNPSPISKKVLNYEDMLVSLVRLDRFDLTRTPNFEPRRGPAVPSYLAAAAAPLLYLPVKGGPEAEVAQWLAALDGVGEDDLRRKMTQKDLRQWKRRHPGHRSFSVLRHPVARAHAAFCTHILPPEGPGSFTQLRQTLIRRYKVPVPDPGHDLAAHRVAFKGFLGFLKGNLAGQTSVRVDASWCSQTQAVAGFGELCLPDRLIREADLGEELPELARAAGLTEVPDFGVIAPEAPFALADVYDDEVEMLAAAAYQRDYMMFGFSRWG